MTEQTAGTQDHQEEKRTRRLFYWLLATRLLFVLALLRLLAPLASADLLGHQLFSQPTWEWCLFSITPCILIYTFRHPEDWKHLKDNLIDVKYSLFIYLAYGLAVFVFQGMWLMSVSVAANSVGFFSIWHLTRKEKGKVHLTKQVPNTHPNDRTNVKWRVTRRALAVKLVFALAVFRLFLPFATKNLFGHQFLPLPTWEWSLASATPCILIYLCRHPEDWKELVNFQQLYIELFLYAYLIYGLLGAYSYEKPVLWIAVANFAVAKIGIWLLNLRTKRRERAAAGGATT